MERKQKKDMKQYTEHSPHAIYKKAITTLMKYIRAMKQKKNMRTEFADT